MFKTSKLTLLLLKIGGVLALVVALRVWHGTKVYSFEQELRTEYETQIALTNAETKSAVSEVDAQVREGENSIAEVEAVERIEVVRVVATNSAETKALQDEVARLRKEIEDYETPILKCDNVMLPDERVQPHTAIDRLLQDVR